MAPDANLGQSYSSVAHRVRVLDPLCLVLDVSQRKTCRHRVFTVNSEQPECLETIR